MLNAKLTVVSLTAGLLALLCLLYWYDWSARPLSKQEIEAYMSIINEQKQEPGGRHDMVALRKLLEADDGKPVYTVNLYKFHERANYPAGLQLSGTGEDAYNRFSQVMVELMAQRGSHPVYGSTWTDGSNNWDRIVIVRYRSRRDLVDLFATEAFANASLHKWASIREHQRMVVQATHLPDAKWIFPFMAMLVAGATWLAGQVMSRRKPNVRS